MCSNGGETLGQRAAFLRFRALTTPSSSVLEAWRHLTAQVSLESHTRHSFFVQ